MVRRLHRLLVVLDDDDGVSLVAQILQAVEQHHVVARMQADRRLVENVDNTDQAAADLSRQLDPLALAPRQRRSGPVQRQVIESAAQQESQPAANLFENLGRDEAAGLVEFQITKEVPRIDDAEVADIGKGEGDG